MFLRSLSIRQVSSYLLICLLIFIFIILISLESSEYFKCAPCSLFNFSSTTTKKPFYRNFNNTEDERISLDDNSIWCLNMANRLDSELYLPDSPTLQSPSINSTKLQRFPYRYSIWRSSPRLYRRLTPCEHNLVMRLLMIIERICRKHNIVFMLAEGSLLGSWRHHDVIPWDDDLDIMIPIEDKDRFVKLVSKMNETLIQYYKLSNSKRKREYYKLFFKHTPSAGSYSWNFPFVDIFLYEQNETHVWQMADPETLTKIEYVFPLVMRPFGELWLPAPRRPEKMYSFDPYDDCKSHFWDHKKETGQREVTVKCADLKSIYPFVERDNQSNSTEVLKINDTIIHTIIYD